jgi:hypothetical protein
MMSALFAFSVGSASAASAAQAATVGTGFTDSTVGAASYRWRNVAIGGSGFVSGIVTSKTQPGLMYSRTDVGGAYRWDKSNSRWIPLTDWLPDSETGFLGIESLAIDPNTSSKLYLLAGISYHNGGKTAILKSSDYGQTFTKIDVTSQFKEDGNGMGRNSGEKLQVDFANGNILYVGTRAKGLFKSIDGGLTWGHLDSLNVAATPNGNGISFVVLDPASVAGGATQKLFLGVSRYGSAGNNLYMSGDAGKTFTAVTGGPTALMPQRAVIGGGNLLVTYANGAGPWGNDATGEGMDQGQVWKYNIASGAWTNISPKLNRAYSGITVDPNNAKHILVSTISVYQAQYGSTNGDRIFSTFDGGATWVDVVARGFALNTSGVPWIDGYSIHWAASIEFDPFDTKTVRVVSGNGIFKTSDIDVTPTTWAFDVAGLEETVPLNLISIPNGPVISAIGDYDGFRHNDVTQYSPINTPIMGTTTGLDFAAQNPNVVARVGKEMYVSHDMGITWKKAAKLKGANGQVALSANGKVIVHSPANSSTSYFSTDFGASWRAVAGLSVNNARPVADPVDANKFYALDGRAMLVSTDAGASFSAAGKVSSAGGSPVIRVAPGHEGDVWVSLYGGGLARSTDSGATFSNLANVAYAAAVGFGKAAAGANYPTVYIWGSVGGVRGLFRSTDVGANWVRVNDDRHQYGGPGDGQFVVGDMNTYGVVYMSTAGRGIVYGKPAN